MGLLGYKELLERFARLEERFAKLEERFAELEKQNEAFYEKLSESPIQVTCVNGQAEVTKPKPPPS